MIAWVYAAMTSPRHFESAGDFSTEKVSHLLAHIPSFRYALTITISWDYNRLGKKQITLQEKIYSFLNLL